MPFLLLINTFVLGQDVPAKDISIADELKKYTRAVWRGAEGDNLNYCYRGPDKIAPGKKYPLLFYLHGSGAGGMIIKDSYWMPMGLRPLPSRKYLLNIRPMSLPVRCPKVSAGWTWPGTPWSTACRPSPIPWSWRWRPWMHL